MAGPLCVCSECLCVHRCVLGYVCLCMCVHVTRLPPETLPTE